MVERVGHGPAGSAQDDAHEEVPDREERAAREVDEAARAQVARVRERKIVQFPARRVVGPVRRLTSRSPRTGA